MKNVVIFSIAFLFIGCNEKHSNTTDQHYKDTLIISNHLDSNTSNNIICLCDVNENEFSNCDTTYFSNKTKLYWLCTKDSIWLTFETNANEKILIHSQYYFDFRLGTHFMKEYPKTLSFSHEWISGCCHPPDIFFIDKHTGQETNRIKSQNFVYIDSNNNILLYFTDTTYNKIEVLDMLTEKVQIKILPRNKISSVMQIEQIQFVSNIFNEPVIDKEKIIIPYNYELNKRNIKDSITIYR